MVEDGNVEWPQSGLGTHWECDQGQEGAALGAWGGAALWDELGAQVRGGS